jgi:hypothetical protein
MNYFRVSYQKKNKPTGTRTFDVLSENATFEYILIDNILNVLCESALGQPYYWEMLNKYVFIHRKKAVGLDCQYIISILDNRTSSNKKIEFEIEIECIKNNSEIDLFFERFEYKTFSKQVIQKKKTTTDWFKKEPAAIKSFLINLEQHSSLKALKKSGLISKATYYRNLKTCQEKGIIVDGKLVKRILVMK